MDRYELAECAHGGSGVESVYVDGTKRSVLLSEVSLISAALALGSNPVAVKYAVGDIEPLPVVALRFTLAGLAVLAVLRFLEPEGVALGRKDLLLMAGLGIVGVGLNNVLFTFGVDLTTASNTALIYATPPLWGMVLVLCSGRSGRGRAASWMFCSRYRGSG